MLGQVVGFGVGKAGNYLGGKFGRSGVPDLAADLPSSGKQAGNLDVSLQAKRLPKLDMDSVHLSSRKDLHLKASTADADLGKLRSHSTISLDVLKVKQVRADYNDYVVHKTSLGEKPLSMSDWKLQVNNLKQNRTIGTELKMAQTANFKQVANHVENRITIATTVDGQIKKVQVDAIGFDSNGKIRIQD